MNKARKVWECLCVKYVLEKHTMSDGLIQVEVFAFEVRHCAGVLIFFVDGVGHLFQCLLVESNFFQLGKTTLAVNLQPSVTLHLFRHSKR